MLGDVVRGGSSPFRPTHRYGDLKAAISAHGTYLKQNLGCSAVGRVVSNELEAPVSNPSRTRQWV